MEYRIKPTFFGNKYKAQYRQDESSKWITLSLHVVMSDAFHAINELKESQELKGTS